MRPIIFLISLSFFFSAAFAQENPVIENSQPYDKTLVKPFLSDLHDKNDYVLTFRTISPQYPEELYDYLVLTKKGAQLTAYNYSPVPKKLTKYGLTADSLKLLWKAYTDFNMFKIKDEKNEFVFCPDKYLVANSYTYEIIMLAGDRMKKLAYNDAEYYNRVCSGMTSRRDIINTASLLHYVINSVVVEPFRITAY